MGAPAIDPRPDCVQDLNRAKVEMIAYFATSDPCLEAISAEKGVG